MGFKIRANPSNEQTLKNLVVLLAVPPDINGEDCRMSRKEGKWDELKRTISWVVPELEKGKALEFQAQFLNDTPERTPKFPVLVRCDYDQLFSGLRVQTEGELQLKMSSRILHRKV